MPFGAVVLADYAGFLLTTVALGDIAVTVRSSAAVFTIPVGPSKGQRMARFRVLGRGGSILIALLLATVVAVFAVPVRGSAQAAPQAPGELWGVGW